MELPSSWTYRLNASKDYVLEGPKGTDAYELPVVLQFVAKAANPGSSAAADSSGIANGFAHTQIVLDRGEHYYLNTPAIYAGIGSHRRQRHCGTSPRGWSR